MNFKLYKNKYDDEIILSIEKEETIIINNCDYIYGLRLSKIKNKGYCNLATVDKKNLIILEEYEILFNENLKEKFKITEENFNKAFMCCKKCCINRENISTTICNIKNIEILFGKLEEMIKEFYTLDFSL